MISIYQVSSPMFRDNGLNRLLVLKPAAVATCKPLAARHSHSTKLEQLERLRSEDTPHRLMITHTIESYWIPSQKKTKSKLQI